MVIGQQCVARLAEQTTLDARPRRQAGRYERRKKRENLCNVLPSRVRKGLIAIKPSCGASEMQMTLVPCATFNEVVARVTAGTVNSAVVPIGNLHAGPVAEVCSLLAQTTQLVVAGTYQRSIRHCLLCLPGQQLEHITGCSPIHRRWPSAMPYWRSKGWHSVLLLIRLAAQGSPVNGDCVGWRPLLVLALRTCTSLPFLPKISRPLRITAPVLPFSSQHRRFFTMTTHCSAN